MCDMCLSDESATFSHLLTMDAVNPQFVDDVTDDDDDDVILSDDEDSLTAADYVTYYVSTNRGAWPRCQWRMQRFEKKGRNNG